MTLTSAINVTDNKIASVTCPPLPAGGLTPTSFITCNGSYTTTQADVDAGKVTNTASAASGSVVSPTTALTINATQTPALALAKSTATATFSSVGATINYTYVVTNSGNTTLFAVVKIADDKIPTVTCPALPPAGLAPTASITCTGSYTTTQADIDAGSISNNASASSGAVTSTVQSVTVNATKQPALTIAKSSTTLGYASAGSVIPYSYRVTNSGNTTLSTAITVTDNKISSVTCPATPGGWPRSECLHNLHRELHRTAIRHRRRRNRQHRIRQVWNYYVAAGHSDHPGRADACSIDHEELDDIGLFHLSVPLSPTRSS